MGHCALVQTLGLCMKFTYTYVFFCYGLRFCSYLYFYLAFFVYFLSIFAFHFYPLEAVERQLRAYILFNTLASKPVFIVVRMFHAGFAWSFNCFCFVIFLSACEKFWHCCSCSDYWRHMALPVHWWQSMALHQKEWNILITRHLSRTFLHLYTVSENK